MSNYVYWAEDDSEAIEHHGILGQKWGVRRYQNEDGSLTYAGKRRYRHFGNSLQRLREANKQYKTNPTDENKNKVNTAKKEVFGSSKRAITGAAIGVAAGLALASLSLSVKKIPGRPALTGGGRQLPEIAGFMQLPSIANRYVNTIAE